jgi:hypothetical protein
LGEIEAVLSRHAEVAECAVVAREDGGGGAEKRLVAYVVGRTVGQDAGIGELRAHLKQQLPDYMVPSAFVMMEALPLTPNGKINRKALPAPEQTRPELERDYAPPRTATEELLAGIWQQVLGIERIGIHDNFFELGGDSILSLQIVSRAQSSGLRLTPKLMFLHQSIGELAAVAEQSAGVEAEQGAVIGEVKLTPIQQWYFERELKQPEHFNQAVMLEVRDSLDAALLKQAVGELIRHHDALRMRFTRSASEWQQFNPPVMDAVPFTSLDFSSVAEAELKTAIEAAAGEAQTSLDLGEGPLLRVVYFEMGAQRSGRLLIFIIKAESVA